jgi:predicted nuclease with TOPRIM domain
MEVTLMTMTNTELHTVMSEQMTAMVAMSKEVRQQFNANAALRAELEKLTKQQEAYKWEIQQGKNLLSRTQVENTKAIDKNITLIDKNSELHRQVRELEDRVQNQRGIAFSKLRT